MWGKERWTRTKPDSCNSNKVSMTKDNGPLENQMRQKWTERKKESWAAVKMTLWNTKLNYTSLFWDKSNARLDKKLQMRIDIMILCWVVGRNTHLRNCYRWEYSICRKMETEYESSWQKKNRLVSFHPSLSSHGLPHDGIWVYGEKPCQHLTMSHKTGIKCTKCNTTLPLMRSFNLSIATEILTGISGFGISALLLLILWRWCVTVLDENNNHILHFLLGQNISQLNTEWHKNMGTFQKPNKNWRNPRKKKLLTEIEPLQLAF